MLFRSRLQTDDEREQFIEQFWLRRDPTPGTVANEAKEEYYRRIGYANRHFSTRMPGWLTTRGRYYIVFGPPDEIENVNHTQTWVYHRFDHTNFDLRLVFGRER